MAGLPEELAGWLRNGTGQRGFHAGRQHGSPELASRPGRFLLSGTNRRAHNRQRETVFS